MEKILGFLVICIPGLILLKNFWFDYKTQLEKRIDNLNNTVQILDKTAKALDGKIQSIVQSQGWDKSSKTIAQDIQELKTKSETLDKQISLLGDQQENFLNNGQNTINFILTIIVAYIGYNTVKEAVLNREEKKEMKEKIKTELKPVLEELKGQDIKEIVMELKWLQYQMTVLSAEQLEKDQYQCLTALYEYIRAMVILGDLKTNQTEQEDNIATKTFLFYQEKNVTRINDILKILIEQDRKKVQDLNTEQAVKFKEILNKIPDAERKKVQPKIEEMLNQITIN